MSSFSVVDQFEFAVAELAGAPYAVAVNTGTSALFLSMAYEKMQHPEIEHVVMPARTFISVPMAAIHAGFKVVFDDYKWLGIYNIGPINVIDSALRFRRKMYQGGLHCLSFHARKLLNIGEGGMILTDNRHAYHWLRKARYSGRSMPSYDITEIDMLGWQCYMTPEKAARGLHLLDYFADWPDQVMEYEDMRKVKVFQKHMVKAA